MAKSLDHGCRIARHRLLGQWRLATTSRAVTRPRRRWQELTQDKICTIKCGLDARHVTDAMKREVFALYGYTGNHDPSAWLMPTAEPAKLTI